MNAECSIGAPCTRNRLRLPLGQLDREDLTDRPFSDRPRFNRGRQERGRLFPDSLDQPVDD